jgi:hypothetical protein
LKLEKRAMTGAGLPPIALEAVLKLLAIGQDTTPTRKAAKAAEKPKLQLGLTMPGAAAPFAATRANASTKRKPQRKPALRGSSHSHPLAEGTKPC